MQVHQQASGRRVVGRRGEGLLAGNHCLRDALVEHQLLREASSSRGKRLPQRRLGRQFHGP